MAKAVEVDALILGGGPAGTSAARALGLSGRSVVLVERSDYEAPRIGEVLHPEGRKPLDALGAWGSFLGDGHLESPGIVSAWGGPEPFERDFVLGVGGPAWHLDRRRFDESLASLAEEAGVRVIRGARASTPSGGPPGAWKVGVEARGGAPFDITARLLVDATGRPAALARRLGRSRIVCDRLVAVVARLPAREGPSGLDRRLLLEPVEDGWWYAARVPDGGQVVAFLTDFDLLGRGRRGDPGRAFVEALGRTEHIKGRVGPGDAGLALRRFDASTSRLDRAAGPGFLALGDAAMALDPLSGRGIARAIAWGLDAAGAISRHLDGEPGALEAYAGRVLDEFTRSRREWSRAYGSERRWPDHPFWSRRQSPRIG